MTRERHIVTCEYPPQIGGVSDYTWMVAKGLAEKGTPVHVWCPPASGHDRPAPGVVVHRDFGDFSRRDMTRVAHKLDEFTAPRKLLVQWVPHGYGRRSLNIQFCLWLWTRARLRGDEVEVMVHEPFVAFREGTWRQDAAAVVHRLMTIILLNSVTRVWVATPTWNDRLSPYFMGRRVPVCWLPIPSTVERRSQLTTDNCTNHHHRQIGHFGTFGRPIADLLEPLIPELLHRRSEKLLLMGRGSQEFAAQIVRSHPDLAGQIQGVGEISGRQLSQFVGTCDVMIQPYPDGVTSRRTTAMVALSHGVPTVTSEGPLTEDVWKNSGAVRLVDHRNRKAFLDAVCELLDDERQRSEMSHRATKLYAARFDISHTLAALCSSASDKRASDLAGLPA